MSAPVSDLVARLRAIAGDLSRDKIAPHAPETVLVGATRISELEAALEPFAQLIEVSDAITVEGARRLQPDVTDMTDEEVAEFVTPSATVMVSEGSMAFGRDGPRPKRAVVTTGDFRRARTLLAGGKRDG